jgi:xanthine dehydrogenase small subunit
MIRFILNRDLVSTDLGPGVLLLDYLRRECRLTGTKQGCREGDCGACSVLVGRRTDDRVRYRCVAACLMPLGELHGKHVLTIEGINLKQLSPVQQNIVDTGATQCGFCTPGIVMAMTGFLMDSPSLCLAAAVTALDGNICRCTGYTAIRRAVQNLVDDLAPFPAEPSRRLTHLVQAGYLPAYLLEMHQRLAAIAPTPGVTGKGDVPVPVGGGTDLFVQRPDRLTRQPLVFLHDDARLSGIIVNNKHIRIGAATPIEDLKGDARLNQIFPFWRKALDHMASTPIRHRATLAGNMVNASPIGDLTIIMLALGAMLTIGGPHGTRRLALEKFYDGYKSVDLAADEWITEVAFARPSSRCRFNVEKVSRRQRLDIASVNTAIALETDAKRITTARISAGGVAPIPLLLTKSAAWLVGQPVCSETLAGLIDIVDSEIAPIDDVRGSARYKRRLLGRLMVAHFGACFPKLDLSACLRSLDQAR